MSCNVNKRVADSAHLLQKNNIYIDSAKTNDIKLYEQLYQKPNSRLLGIPVRLHIYNLASVDPDSSYHNWLYKKPKREERLIRFLSKKQVERLGNSYKGITNWVKKTGEPPMVVDESKTERSLKRLQAYYWNNGWFNAKADYTLKKKKNQKATTHYYITPNIPYIIDTIHPKIAASAADSIYRKTLKNSALSAGQQFKTATIEEERERITDIFRNNGLYHFEKEYVKFDADTVNTDHKVHLNLLINNRQKTTGNTIEKIPFKVHSIKKVNIYTDYSYTNRNKKPKDSLFYRGYQIYSFDKMRYTRKAMTNAVLIKPGSIFKDQDRTQTYNQINALKTFKYPNIRYDVDPNNPDGTDLIANILLTPRKKYSTDIEFDVSTSNIQAFGIGFGGSLLIRNIFKGTETLEISGRGSIGSSKDAIGANDRFFNISEIGADAKLSFPKILFPIRTNSIIKKYMSPKTTIIFGINNQQNIGLDKLNASGIFSYQWKPKSTITHKIDLINAQYVRNLNTSNYFNVYRNSFVDLNTIAQQVLPIDSPLFIQNPEFPITSRQDAVLTIPDGANDFITEILNDQDTFPDDSPTSKSIRSINERKERLTEDNLIFTSNYTYTRNTRSSIYDNSYSLFKGKIEFAGNILNTIANAGGSPKNENDTFEIFGVEFAQYIKTELDYIKHWSVGKRNTIAFRAKGGIAIPYGNANNIPFARSFFAGGPNDNRAWIAYELGPGSSGGRNEFNEANLKLALNLEYRYSIINALKGAFFIDIGNIWNVLDNVDEEEAVFSRLDDIQELAVGTGLGLRYDFDFFVLRLDVGFKTFNPANDEDQRWFKGYNFTKAVYNVGINYPF